MLSAVMFIERGPVGVVVKVLVRLPFLLPVVSIMVIGYFFIQPALYRTR